jgi:hypothetical protein
LFLVGAAARLPSARNVTCATSDRPKPIYNLSPWAPAPLFRALLAPRSNPRARGSFCASVVSPYPDKIAERVAACRSRAGFSPPRPLRRRPEKRVMHVPGLDPGIDPYPRPMSRGIIAEGPASRSRTRASKMPRRGLPALRRSRQLPGSRYRFIRSPRLDPRFRGDDA